MEALCALEAIEERMKAQTKREVVVWWCSACAKDYRGGEPVPPSCREAGHAVVREKRTLHYFRCSGCKHRLAHPAAMCAVACPKCSARGLWVAASMYNIKEADERGLHPTLAQHQPQEIMSLRFG